MVLDASELHVREHVGFVFPALCAVPSYDDFENVAFGLRVKPRKVRPNENVIQQKVKQLLELVQLNHVAESLSNPTFRWSASAWR